MTTIVNPLAEERFRVAGRSRPGHGARAPEVYISLDEIMACARPDGERLYVDNDNTPDPDRFIHWVKPGCRRVFRVEYSAVPGIDAFDGEPLHPDDEAAFERDWIPQETWWQVLRARRLLWNSIAPAEVSGWEGYARVVSSLFADDLASHFGSAAQAMADLANSIAKSNVAFDSIVNRLVATAPEGAGAGLAGLGFTPAPEVSLEDPVGAP